MHYYDYNYKVKTKEIAIREIIILYLKYARSKYLRK